MARLAKETLRKEMRARRKRLTPAEKVRASASVNAQILRRADVRPRAKHV